MISVLIVGDTQEAIQASVLSVRGQAETVTVLARPDAQAWNQAAEEATGEFLLPLPAGSTFSEGSIQALVPPYSYPAMVVEPSPDTLRLRVPGDFSFQRLVREPYLPPSLMHPKKDWKETGGWPEGMGALIHWAYQLVLLNEKAPLFVQRAVLFYRPAGQKPTWDDYLSMRHRYLPLYRVKHAEQEANGQPAPQLSANGYAGGMPGSAGMTLLRYIGGNCGDMTWYGPVTNQRYVMGGVNKERYVDQRDAQAMLAISDSGLPAFEEARR